MRRSRALGADSVPESTAMRYCTMAWGMDQQAGDQFPAIASAGETSSMTRSFHASANSLQPLRVTLAVRQAAAHAEGNIGDRVGDDDQVRMLKRSWRLNDFGGAFNTPCKTSISVLSKVSGRGRS